MPRTALILVAAAAFAAGSLYARGRTNPHLDPSLVRSGCPACHIGHGQSKSPMLSEPQQATCFRCHGATAPAGNGDVGADAKPALIGSLAAKVSVHRIDDREYSGSDPNVVVCTSCHSPHRNIAEVRPDKPNGIRFRAPNDPSIYENDLCLRCHGRMARFDVATLVSSTSRSYHPLVSPSPERSMTVDPALGGKLINCTDCHGNSDRSGPQGPHASDVPGLLKKAYRQGDGAAESRAAFELCYACHEREAVLQRSTFPKHSLHVADEKIACATCHDPHGAANSRAMIRIAEPGTAGITPSLKTGRLAFVSDAPGSGACYLNCHGVEHGPQTYGAAAIPEQVRSSVPSMPPNTIRIAPRDARPHDPRGPGQGKSRDPERP